MSFQNPLESLPPASSPTPDTNVPDSQCSICPKGECFPLPTAEDYARERERLQRLAADHRARGREVVVVMGVGFVGAVMAGVVADAVDKRTGAVTSLRDKKAGADWGGARVGRLYAARELGCDVPLNVDESAPLDDETVESVQLSALGPVFAMVTITKSILKAHVTQDIVIWEHGIDAVDMRTTVLWHGQHKVQIRQCLPTAARKEDVFYGTPFYGNNWRGVLPGSGPRNPDEMASRECWDDYRELQLWVHQKRQDSEIGRAHV
jgi:hypothetical protein